MACKAERARRIVQEVFTGLRACRSVAEVEALCEHGSIRSSRMPLKKYPKLQISLTRREVEQLRLEGWLSEDGYSINHERINDDSHPLIKLLYAQAWKNGDVGKHRHIARGAAEAATPERNCASAFVYYQFGAHLADRAAEPIIDQHVLRAYGIYRAGDDMDKIRKLLKLGQLRNSHQYLIDGYRVWLADSDDLIPALRAETGWRYAVDQVLFATGKAVK